MKGDALLKLFFPDKSMEDIDQEEELVRVPIDIPSYVNEQLKTKAKLNNVSRNRFLNQIILRYLETEG